MIDDEEKMGGCLIRVFGELDHIVRGDNRGAQSAERRDILHCTDCFNRKRG